MNTDEKIQLFSEILNFSHPVNIWKYDANLNPLRNKHLNNGNVGDLKFMQIEDTILENISNNGKYPFFIENKSGLIFIVAYEYVHDPLHVYVLGPSLSGLNSLSIYQTSLDKMNSDKTTYTLQAIDKAPIISTTSLIRYATILHYLLNDEKIVDNQIIYSYDKSSSKEAINNISAKHMGIYEAEQNFLRLVKEGNPQYHKGLQKMTSLSSGMRVDEGSGLQNARNNVFVLLTLVSRASIEAGLSPDVSYDLNDYYAKLLNNCQNISEVAKASQELLDDYVKRNHALHNKEMSIPIRYACEYISLHINEELSIDELSHRVGYTNYYFSHKFKKETGKTVAQYIKDAKLEVAKTMLASSNKSINDIYIDLGFGSRNHFFTTFKKAAGLSPTQYRENITANKKSQ